MSSPPYCLRRDGNALESTRQAMQKAYNFAERCAEAPAGRLPSLPAPYSGTKCIDRSNSACRSWAARASLDSASLLSGCPASMPMASTRSR